MTFQRRSRRIVYAAHIRESDQAIQSVQAHLLEVKALAEAHGAKIGVAHLAGLTGLLHDLGKFSSAFQTYLYEAVRHPDAPPKRGSVDHSTAGGKLLYDLLHRGKPNLHNWLLAELAGNVIISHHAYLQDYLTPELTSDYLRRVRDKGVIPEYAPEYAQEYEEAVALFYKHVMNEQALADYIQAALDELKAYMEKDRDTPLVMEARLLFLTKFVFSALIDADRTNTREFEQNLPPESAPLHHELFQAYHEQLMQHLNKLKPTTAAGKDRINQLRAEMSEQCSVFAARPSGIYKLSIPTGGGKTLASLRYALEHALAYKKQRIIYVVPYTTIIEQNADEVRRILNAHEHVLEHHSNVIADEQDDDELLDGRMSPAYKLKLAKDNWDAPIIFTTMVQFLNVFYAKGTRNIRRLHNMSHAVVIFDEVQKVPLHCVSLFNLAVNGLRTFAHSSMLLCTATQPALDDAPHRLLLSADAEIVQRLDEVVEAFRRVEVTDLTATGPMNTEEVARLVTEQAEQKRSVLVILNTKKAVRKLFDQLTANKRLDVPVFHLSTSMCPAHRKEQLNTVRDLLKAQKPVICVSTQLIEAGVDVSFRCVIRSLAGADSIAQAAGRCNRHGEEARGAVYLIDHGEESLKSLKEIAVGKKETMNILRDIRLDAGQHGGELLSLQAMRRYFERLNRQFEEELNYPIAKLDLLPMTELLWGQRRASKWVSEYRALHNKELDQQCLINSYYTAARHFEVIDSVTTTVIVPYGQQGRELIAELNGNPPLHRLSTLLRQAQQYSVNLFDQEKRLLVQSGGIESVLDGKVLVLREGAYSKVYGVDLGSGAELEPAVW